MTLTYKDFTLKFTLDDVATKVYKAHDPESLENQLFGYMSILDDPSSSYVSTVDMINEIERIIYKYPSKNGFIDYDESHYPTVNVVSN